MVDYRGFCRMWWGLCPPVYAQQEDETAKGKGLSKAFRAAAHSVIPTVVKIKNISKGKRVEGLTEKSRGGNPFRGTPFEDFFDGEEFPPGTQFQRFIPPRMGVGSGVIIDPKGIILTNNHVVEGADEVLVELVDGRQLKATDVKSDEQSDLAIMRVKTNAPLPAAVFGDSDAMDIGDWVIAIGCPFELDSTVSPESSAAKADRYPGRAGPAFCRPTPPSIPEIRADHW